MPKSSVDDRKIKKDEPLRRRTRWAINYVTAENGLTNKDIGTATGVNHATVSSYRVMNTSPKAQFIKEFCRLYGFNEAWFLNGTGEPFPGAREKYPEVCGPVVDGEGIQGIPSINEAASDYGDFIFIPQVADQISAGAGVVPYNNVELRVAFRRDWIKRKGDPRNMSLIKVVGDSMEPTLLSGDLVLVDHGRTRVDPQGGIYAIAIDHEIMIKRIQPLHFMGTLKIISDNKRYGAIDADADSLNINGKVIWFARDIER